MSLKVGVDFDGNKWVELFKAPGDADNLFGKNAAQPFNLKRTTVAGGFTAVTDANTPSDQQFYGRRSLVLDGTSSTDRYAIGFDSVDYDITGQPSGTYSGSVWVYAGFGVDVTMRLRLISSGGTEIIGSTATVNNSTGWVRLTASGSLPHSSQSIRVDVECTAHAISGDVYVAGPMIVAGASLPQYLNCGTDSQYENISDYVLRANWSSGFVRPYQYVAGLGQASLTLSNTDKRFSPEYSSGPLYGNFVANRVVKINSETTELWGGFVDTWMPQAGTNYDQQCVLKATDGMKFLHDTEIFPDLQTAQPPYALVQHILEKVKENAPELFSLYEFLPDDLENIEVETVPYFFDQTPNEGEESGRQPVDLLEEIFVGIQAKFWITRNGGVNYKGPAEDGGAVAATFDNTAISIDYQWAQNVINECTVHAYPRTYGDFGKLWRLEDTPFTVDAGATEYIRAYYTDATTGRRCGADATTVVLDNLSYSGANTVATLNDIDAMSAEIKVVNSGGSSQDVLSARLRGNSLRARESIARTRSDATSIAANGRRGEVIDSKWVAKGKWAKRLAQFRIDRFKDARGEVVSLTGRYDVDSQFADCWIGRKINVQDDQLAHNADYIVIGEDHRWSVGDEHWTKLYLERATTAKVSTTVV